MLDSEYQNLRRAASREAEKADYEALDQYMNKLMESWDSLKTKYRIPFRELGYSNDFDLFQDLEIDSVQRYVHVSHAIGERERVGSNPEIP